MLLPAVAALCLLSVPAHAWQGWRPGYRPAPGRAVAFHGRPIRTRVVAVRARAGRPAIPVGKRAAPPEPNPGAASATLPKKPEAAASWTAGERPCFRGRRKLWQDGEGWVVKKVSVCP